VAVAAASTAAIPHEPVYDAWAWLVWGRELAALELDTSSGPSWKPLTVVVAAGLSLTGEAAPRLWLVLVQAAWLLALVLAARLAYDLASAESRSLRIAAAAFAAMSLVLLADDVTLWSRQGAAGMCEPLAVALVLAAASAAVLGRWRLSLAVAALVALVRPEAGPLLIVYGLWHWRRDPALRPWVAGLALAVPALWVVPDLLTSGGAPSAATRARRRDTGMPAEAAGDVLAYAAAMPLAVVWPLVVVAVVGVLASRRRARPAGLGGALPVLAVGALFWIATVAAMAAAGFSGLPRYIAPAVAVAGVVAGVGVAQLLGAVRQRRTAAAIAGVALLAAAAQVPSRADQIPRGLARVADTARANDRLRSLVRRVGYERLLRCGRLRTTDIQVRTALAWQLGVPLARVPSIAAPPRIRMTLVLGPRASASMRAAMRADGKLLGRRGEWRVYSWDCPP
jgi:hypothetical protein